MKDELSQSYPVVERRELEPVSPRGLMGVGGRRRGPGDLPRLAGHQVAVYRVGENWIENHGNVSRRDDIAVRASSVTVVDKRRDVHVSAMVTIPSAESADFAVRARFRCTVTDAAALVREGPEDASGALEGYLRGCPGLTEEGLDYGASDVGEVRKRVSARLTVTSDVSPPEFTGLHAALVDVEVLTPRALQEFKERMEELRQQRERVAVEQAVEQARMVQEQEHQQELAAQQAEHDRRMRELEQEFEQRSAEQKASFERRQAQEDADSTGLDWKEFFLRAYTKGELTAQQMAERLRSTEREEQEARERKEELERVLLEKLSAIQREDGRLVADREDERWKVERLEAARLELAEREDRNRQSKENREDRLRAAQEARISREQGLQMEFEIYKQFIQEGHTNITPIDMTGMLERILRKNRSEEPPRMPEVDDVDKPSLPGEAADDRSGPDADGTAKQPVVGGAESEIDEDDVHDIGDWGREEVRDDDGS